ncbi:unnamed protein product, partial [Ceratitis capitata]
LRNLDSTNHNTTVRSTHQHITATSVEYSKEFRPTQPNTVPPTAPSNLPLFLNNVFNHQRTS